MAGVSDVALRPGAGVRVGAAVGDWLPLVAAVGAAASGGTVSLVLPLVVLVVVAGSAGVAAASTLSAPLAGPRYLLPVLVEVRHGSCSNLVRGASGSEEASYATTRTCEGGGRKQRRWNKQRKDHQLSLLSSSFSEDVSAPKNTNDAILEK